MGNSDHALREELYCIIHNYAQLSKSSKRGEHYVIGQIGRILERSDPYLLVMIRELLTPLEKGTLTFQEVIYAIIRAAQEFPDHQALLDSRSEIQKIEEQGGRFLIYAVKWLDSPAYVRPTVQDAQNIQKKLAELNRKYRKRYASEEDTTTLIPCFVLQRDGESIDNNMTRVVDLVKRALLEMYHLMLEYEPAKAFYFFPRASRKEIEDDIMILAWYLFRSGLPVERIASGYYKDAVGEFLNEKILDYLIGSEKMVDSLLGVSCHLALISLIDFASFFEIPGDFIDLEDPKEVAQRAKIIKTRNRRGANLLRKMIDLEKIYSSKPQGKFVIQYLHYRYYGSFGGYYGDHRYMDPRGQQALKVYKDALDRSAREKQAEKELAESSRGFSSKTTEQMSQLLGLLRKSIHEPSKVRGKKVKILGDISSGAMGTVSVGIFQEHIVALKKVKAQATSMLGDAQGLLEYEAALNEAVQSPEQHPCIAEYHGLVEEGEERILIHGFYPNDNLTDLVEKNWNEKYRPPFVTQSKLTLATMEVIINQLLDCLRHMKKKNVVHRDLKTDNILYMVGDSGEVNLIKVIDFGVALTVGPSAIEDLFKGKVVGTFSYMAPEQGKSRSEFQSDLYSAGAIFTVLLTGKLPMVFAKTKTRQELINQLVRIEKEPRPKLADLNPYLKEYTVLEHIAATVDGMLDLNAKTRPDLEEVQAAFDGLFQHIGDDKHQLSIFYTR